MDVGLIISVVGTASSAMFTVFLVGAVGYLAALYPKNDVLLAPSTLKATARLTSVIFIPALIIAVLGANISINVLKDMSILLVICIINTLVSYVIAVAVGGLMLDRKSPLFTALTIACSFPNSTSLPMLVLQSACEQGMVNEDYDGDKEECYEAGTSMLFVYVILWNFLFWGYAFAALQKASEILLLESSPSCSAPLVVQQDVSTLDNVIRNRTRSISAESIRRRSIELEPDINAWSHLRKYLKIANSYLIAAAVGFVDIMANPPMIGVVIGLFIGVIRPLQILFFEDSMSPFFPLGISISTLGEPVVCVSALLMAASLAQVKIDIKEATMYQFYCKLADSTFGGYDSILSGGNGIELNSPISNNSPVPDSAETPLDQQEDANNCNVTTVVLNDHIDPSSLVDSSDSLPANPSTTSSAPSESDLPSNHYILTHAVCRLVLPPMIMIPIMMAFVNIGLIGKSQRLLQLVIVMESCVPSAQLIMLVLNQLGLYEMAGKMAYMYVFHYIISIFTMTFWFSVGMLIIYH